MSVFRFSKQSKTKNQTENSLFPIQPNKSVNINYGKLSCSKEHHRVNVKTNDFGSKNMFE